MAGGGRTAAHQGQTPHHAPAPPLGTSGRLCKQRTTSGNSKHAGDDDHCFSTRAEGASMLRPATFWDNRTRCGRALRMRQQITMLPICCPIPPLGHCPVFPTARPQAHLPAEGSSSSGKWFLRASPSREQLRDASPATGPFSHGRISECIRVLSLSRVRPPLVCRVAAFVRDGQFFPKQKFHHFFATTFACRNPGKFRAWLQ